MKITTDNDIIDYVKKIMIHGNIGTEVMLNFYVNDTNRMGKSYRFRDVNIDNMNAFLFDLNLRSRIREIYSYFGYEQGIADRVCGFDLMVEPFTDGTTNITPKLVEFFNLLVVPYTLDKLKEPFRQQPMRAHWFDYGGIPIMPPEPNIWEWLEENF